MFRLTIYNATGLLSSSTRLASLIQILPLRGRECWKEEWTDRNFKVAQNFPFLHLNFPQVESKCAVYTSTFYFILFVYYSIKKHIMHTFCQCILSTHCKSLTINLCKIGCHKDALLFYILDTFLMFLTYFILQFCMYYLLLVMISLIKWPECKITYSWYPITSWQNMIIIYSVERMVPGYSRRRNMWKNY